MGRKRNDETHEYKANAHPVPPAHRKMIEDTLAKGLIRAVGDLYEITELGHEYTRALTARNLNPSTSEGNAP